MSQRLRVSAYFYIPTYLTRVNYSSLHLSVFTRNYSVLTFILMMRIALR